MLMIGDNLDNFTIAAGEAWIMSVQMRAWEGSSIIDWSNRRLVLSFYGPGRTLETQIEGVYVTDKGDPYFAFIRDGSFSESLYGKSLRIELAERLNNSRAIIRSGSLTVVESSNGVTTYGQRIGLTDCRFGIFFNPNNTIREISQDLLDFAGTVVAPTLSALSLSSPLVAGTGSSGTISGATAGSTITDNIAGLTINSANRTYSWDGTGSAGTVANALVEMLAGATNSPRTTPLTIGAAVPVLGNLSLSVSGATVGTSATIAIQGATSGSTITGTPPDGMTLNSSARTISGTPTQAGTYNIVLTETLAGATGSPKQTTVTITVAAAPVTLSALSLASPSMTENTAPGTTISGIIGKTAGSTLSLADADGGRFAISGTNLQTGATNIDYEQGSSRTLVIRETLAGATNSPRDTTLAVGVVNVNEQPSLRALMLSSTSLTTGTSASGTINEAATGSTITGSGFPTGFTINGPARTWAYDGTGSAGTSTVRLTETLGDSPNSPRQTDIGVTVAAGVQPITIEPAAWAFSEGFDGTNGSLVKGRPGWSSDTSDLLLIRDGRMRGDYAGQFGEQGGYIGDASYGDNFEVEFQFNITSDFQAGGAFVNMLVAGSQRIALRQQGRGLVMAATNAAGQGSTIIWDAGPGTDTLGSHTVLVRFVNGLIQAKRDGAMVVARTDFAKPIDQRQLGYISRNELFGGAGNPGKVGLSVYTRPYDYFEGAKVRTVALAIKYADRVMGVREVGATSGDCRLSGYVSGSASRWVYRLRSLLAPATVMKDWADASITVSGTSFSGTASIPLGGPYILDFGFIDAAGKYWGDDGRDVCCGYIWCGYGQSNTTGYATNLIPAGFPTHPKAASATVHNAVAQPNTAVADDNPDSRYVFIANGTYEGTNKPTASYLIAVAAASTLDAPVIVIIGGRPANSLSALVPGNPPFDGQPAWDITLPLTERIAALSGIVTGFFIDQGEADTESAQPNPNWAATFKQQLLPGLRTVGRNPNPMILMAPPGRRNSTTPVAAAATWTQEDRNAQVLREQVMQIINDPTCNATLAASKLGIHFGDGDPVHYSLSEAGLFENARRNGYSIANRTNPAIPDGRGPIPTSLSRSGATLTLDINLNGATGLTDFTGQKYSNNTYSDAYLPNTIRGYQISATSDFATLLPGTAAVAGGKIVFTMASAPTGPVYIRSFYGKSYTDDLMVRGTYADGRNPIPVAPIWLPLMSN